MQKVANLVIGAKSAHAKASEKYVAVSIEFADGKRWDGLIPTEYRRTGVHCKDDQEIEEYLNNIAPKLHPSEIPAWRKDQNEFWQQKPNASVTKGVFDKLATFKWTCTSCGFPKNTNIARRYQDLKEFGYTIASRKMSCTTCQEPRLCLLLVPLPRGGTTGYEQWSKALRAKIINVLKSYDAYEAKTVDPHGLLPDHKFPEIRWDEETRRSSLENLSDQEIERDFQLLNNQRNQQKREVCRQCYNSGMRPGIYGIQYYATGDDSWPKNVPTRGKDAEAGCVGCPWYDIEEWRKSLNSKIS